MDYDQNVKQEIIQKLTEANINRSQVNKVLPRIEKTLARAHGDQLIFSIQKMLDDGRRQLAQLESDVKLYETALDQLKNFSIEQIQALPTGPTATQVREQQFYQGFYQTGTGSGFFK